MTKRATLLGLFFLLTLAVLGYYTLFLVDFSPFRKKAEITVHFSETNGLREGDSVLVAGMRWGRVKELRFDPHAQNDRRITVTAALDEPLVLREGFSIAINDATLLGGKNLAVDPGPADAAEVAPGQPLFGEVAPNPLDAIGELVAESSKGIDQIVDDLGAVVKNIREGEGLAGRLIHDTTLAENMAATVDSAAKTLGSMQTIAADLAQGRGTAGMLIEDDALYVELLATTRKLNVMLDETTALVRGVGSGDGIAARLLSDDALAEQFARTVIDLGDVVDRVSRGQGTLGRLVTDDTIARNVETITTRIVDGEGIAGLITKPEIYDNVLQITDDVATITGAMRNGQGTFGRLMMDPEIYNQVKTALGIVERSLEEYREAGPITTFTSVFFAAF